nr:MAG TPA: hypothetical protein [Caudoviricetes sp.]
MNFSFPFKLSRVLYVVSSQNNSLLYPGGPGTLRRPVRFRRCVRPKQNPPEVPDQHLRGII